MPTNKLSDARLRNLKSTDTSNLADGGGLYLHTADTGRRTWRITETPPKVGDSAGVDHTLVRAVRDTSPETRAAILRLLSGAET